MNLGIRMHPSTKTKLFIVIVFTLEILHIDCQNKDAFPPYFFVCSYHGNSEKPSLESKEVTVNVAIDGNPSYYIPGEKYTVRISSSKNFDSIHVTGLYTMKSNHIPQLPSLSVGSNEPFGENFMCSIVHSHISHEPRNELQFLWLAPANGTGCISFLASASLAQSIMFSQVTVMQLCEEGDAESNPTRPTLASLHDDGVIFRDDFDTTESFNSELWSNCDGVGVSDYCGVIIHGKAGVACILKEDKDRQLITVPLNLTTAEVLQFSTGSGTCHNSDGNEQIQLFYSIDTSCTRWVYYNEFTLLSTAGVATHLFKIPKEAKRSDTCLRWLQPLHPNGSSYVGCWAIDNVLVSNKAETSDVLQENFDPVDTDNWLFFPGAQIRHKCHSESTALVFDNNNQLYNYAVTKDINLETENLTALLTEDFEGGFSQRWHVRKSANSILWKVNTVRKLELPKSWIIEGGQLNTSCGEIYSGKSVVMSGRSKSRKLCTPYMDLSHAGTIQFHYSQGNSQCSTFNENWSKVFCFAENRFGHSVLLRMLLPEDNEEPELKILPIPPKARNPNSRICWIQKAHEGEDKDVWAVDHVVVYAEKASNSENYAQFALNMNCGLHAGNSSMEFEYSVDLGQNWYPLHQQCLARECHHQQIITSSSFNTLDVDSWVRITQRIPVAALASHTRFRWIQTSAIGKSGWAVDSIYIGYCEEGCNGHGYCLQTGCRCDLGFTGPTCAYTTGPLPSLLIETMTTIPSINRNFPVVRGGSLGYRCGVVATGKAVVFHSVGSRVIETMNLNTTDAKFLQFSIRVGSESDVGDCSPPNSKDEAILLQATCNGGIDWTNLKTMFGKNYRQPSLISVKIPSHLQESVCKFRWFQPKHSGLNQDVWALDDVSLTRTKFNTIELDFSDATMVESVLDVHLGEIGDYCGYSDVLSFTEPYQEGENRYVSTNSMQIGPSYVLQFDLKMGCHQPFLNKLDNDLYLEYSLDHAMNWNLVKEGCWPPNMCEDYHEATKYNSAKYKDWQRITVTLPSHTWSSATRFRWRQAKWASSDSWAINNLYIGQRCPKNCNGHGQCFHGSCICDNGYHGGTCTPTTKLPSKLNSDFSLMRQLEFNWLTIIGGAIVGANEGCGTLLSGETLYFSQHSPRELVTKDLNTNNIDYVEFYLRMGHENYDRLCRGIEHRSENVILQYSNDGGITWKTIKELQAFDYSKASFEHIKVPSSSRTLSTRFRWWQPTHDGEFTDQWAIDQVNIGSYEHYNEIRDNFELQADQPASKAHQVWQLITEGMYASYCQSDTDTLMFADQLNDKVAMTKDLQLRRGDIVQFRINVGCSRSFSYHHPVLLQYTQDAGMNWELVEKPCYVRDNCHEKYTEGSIYYSGTHGHWVLVILPLSQEITQKPVNLRWWQKGGPTSSFALDDVYIGPPCPDMCNGHGACDYGTVCRCDPGYNTSNNCASSYTGSLYMVDRFDNRNYFGDLWSHILGGDLGLGCGIIDSGTSLYFSEEGTREARTVPLNMEYLRVLQFVIRIGSRDNHKGCRKPTSRDEAVIVDYSIDGGITWHVLRILDPAMLSDGPKLFTTYIPDHAKTEATALRWWQPVISPGTQRAEWAIDSVVIAVNESATVGFEEHFNPMQPEVWYMSMNAVPRITCSSKNDALVFIKNGGKMRYAETWDYQVTPSTFLQFDIAMACTGTYSTLYNVMLQYSTDMGKHWRPVIEECLPPRTDCRGYHQSSQFQSDQHTNWTRSTLYLPSESVSSATRFRWIQDQVSLRGNIWALDNIYLGEGCPWLCSGHGYCHYGECVCDKGFGGEYCFPTTPLPMSIKEEFDLPLSKDIWIEIHGGEVTDICGDLVTGNSITFFKNVLRLIVTTDIDTSMSTFVQFTFKYGCHYVPPDWPKEQTVLLQYSTSGGITWDLLKEIHYKNYSDARYFSLPLPSPAQSNATRFRFWQPDHIGYMNSVWSIDNFYVGGSPMLSDTLYDTFDGPPNPNSWLFWPGGRIAKFCSYNTRSDSIMSGSSGMVFSRGAGQHSITTHDLIVNEMTVIQFDINVGCTAQPTKYAPVRLEYSADYGLTWKLVVPTCSHNAVTCHDPIQDPSIYYAGETPFWRRVVIPFNSLKIYGSVRFRWYQGHFTIKDAIPEWAIDSVFIGMQCIDNCNGHGSCMNDGMFCQCDDGYSEMSCSYSDSNPTFVKEEFEGNNRPLETSQWVYTSGGFKTSKCDSLLSGQSLMFSETGARHATTHDLNLHKASVVQFYIKRGCSDPSDIPRMDSEPVLLQYSTNGGITWTTLENFCFMKGTNQPEYVAVELPHTARTNSTRIRWWQPSESGMYVENWAIDQVYIGGDIHGRLVLEDDLSYNYNDHWLMYPGAVVQPTCGHTGNTLHFSDASDKRFAVTGDVKVTDSTYLQFYISVGCIVYGKCFGIDLEYSKDFGKTWQSVIEKCLPTDIDCVKFHRGSVYTSDVYNKWNRVTVHLPVYTRSTSTRFRWIQQKPFERSQSWAITQIYIGDECDCSCAGHGRCRRGTCICDKGWIGESCDNPESPLPTSMRDSFNLPPEKDDKITVYGGQISNECGNLASGSALHFKGACIRELATQDLDLRKSTFIQFYFKFGCVNDPSNRDENVLVDFSRNGGIQWTSMAELYYDQYLNTSYIMVELPQEAKQNGVRIRWWQPSHPGQSMSDWAIDNVFIGGKDVNPNEVKDDFTNREKEYTWIETDNAVIGPYCGSSFSISGKATSKEAVTLTTIDTTIKPKYIIQFSISVGCNASKSEIFPAGKTVAPVHLQFSKDHGTHWDHLVQECLPFLPGCSGKAQTASIYYPSGGWKRVTIPLDGPPVSEATRFRWQQKITHDNLIPQDWAIDDLYIGQACKNMCNGHGQCDYPDCICDRGYRGDACQFGSSSRIFLKDTFDDQAVLDRNKWYMIQGGSIGKGCRILSDGNSLNMAGTGQRQIITVDLDLRNARFIQYVATIGSQSSVMGCQTPKSRTENIVLQFSTNGGITWTTLHILDFSMYWKSPHYDYIDLPLDARSSHTRFRWWQPVRSDTHNPPASWSIDNVYIGGYEINPSYLEEHFEDLVDEQKFEFHPHSQLWTDVCSRRGKAMVWSEKAIQKYITTQQLIIQEGYMMQFKIQVGCGSDKYMCNTQQPIILQYNKDPHLDVWQDILPRCMLNDHDINMDCPPYRFHQGSVYTANAESKWTRITLQLPPKLFSGNTRFKWTQAGTNNVGPSWSIDDLYIGEKCPSLCNGRGDCVQQKCVCDRGYTGETCKPAKDHLPKDMIDGFEGILSTSKWHRVDGRGKGNGCGSLLPQSHGKNLYFNGCGMRQAITTELDLSQVSKIMFVLQIGSLQQSFNCNVNLKPAVSESTGWVFLQYTRNKGIDWHLVATHDPSDFLQPRRVGYALNPDARVAGVQFRWWQAEHGGKGFDQWALDSVEIIKGNREHHHRTNPRNLNRQWHFGNHNLRKARNVQRTWNLGT